MWFVLLSKCISSLSTPAQTVAIMDNTTLLLALLLVMVTSCSAVGSKCYGSPPQCAINKFYYRADRNRCEVVSSEGASCLFPGALTRAPSTNVFDTLAECMTACVHGK